MSEQDRKVRALTDIQTIYSKIAISDDFDIFKYVSTDSEGKIKTFT